MLTTCLCERTQIFVTMISGSLVSKGCLLPLSGMHACRGPTLDHVCNMLSGCFQTPHRHACTAHSPPVETLDGCLGSRKRPMLGADSSTVRAFVPSEPELMCEG